MRKRIVTKRAERIPEEDLAAATFRDGADASGEASPTVELDADTDQQTGADTLGSTRLGEQVAFVLEAVEIAASAIREEARKEAEQILEHAREEAASALHEATKLRAEAEEASKLTREGADLYAEDRRQEAEAEASRVLAAAEQEAALRVEGKDQRQRALDEGIELSESRLNQLTVGLRTLTTLIENLLQTEGVPVQETEREAGEPEETLDESLKASLASHGTA